MIMVPHAVCRHVESGQLKAVNMATHEVFYLRRGKRWVRSYMSTLDILRYTTLVGIYNMRLNLN